MGIDVETYRCRIGRFIGGLGHKQLTNLGYSTVMHHEACGVSAVGAVVFISILLIMGGIEKNPGPTDLKYTFRYQYLLMEVGTSMLRKLFDHQVGPDFKQYLDTHTAAEKQFKFLIGKKIITPAQQQYLPPVDNKPSSSNFDITLLCCLLKNVCGLRPYGEVVWMNPLSTDTSVEAYVTRLRECRNNLLHSGSVSMSEADLTVKWKELVVILNGLNTFCGIKTLTSLINDVEKRDIDEELKQRFDDMLEAWIQMDTMYDHGIGEVMHEVTTVKHTLTKVVMGNEKLQEDITTLAEEFRETHRHNRRTEQEKESHYSLKQTDIQKDIIKYYQQHCRTLPVSPLFENKDEYLLNIYKSLTMFSIEQTKESKQISDYESLFFKEGVSYKQVYITADAGVGKTSFCTCMCLLWSMAMSGCKLEKKHEELQKDMEYMSKFDFVFYINLRDTSHTHVVKMIMEQLFYDSRENYELAIQSILRDKPCLIILDSLDEWDPKSSDKKEYKLPERIYSDTCVCLTTCRPHRMESVRLSHKRDIDQLVKITGLHGDSSKSYIKDVISYMNKEHSSNRNAEDFTNDIHKCGLTNQLNIPIIVSHLVIFWFEKTLTVMPRALIYANIVEMVFKRAEKRKVKCPSISPPTRQLPDSLSGMEHLNKYFGLLYNVCHLSFRSLFKQDENVSSLVFTKQQLQAKPYCFSIEETDFLCKIGILSKNEVSGCYTEERLKISFIHKSYIEFFTALYITSFDSSNAFTDITKKWKSLNNVLQYENLFLLLAGFSYDRVKILFDDIHLTISDDLSLCRKNAIFHYDQDTYSEQIKSLQTIVNKCYMEVSSTYTCNSNILLKLEDFIFGSPSGNNDDDSYSDDDDDYDSHSGDDDGSNDLASSCTAPSGNDDITSLKDLLALNKTSVKSIFSENGKYFDVFDQIKNLQWLNIGKVLPADYKNFTQFILENTSTLHTVCIKGDSDTEPLIPELPVRSLQHLTSLFLSDVKMRHNSLHDLVKFLSDNFIIENIKLDSVYCDNHQDDDSACTLTLNLPHHAKLASLELWYVNILCNNVNKSSLKSITLCTLSERIVRTYIDVFNCVKDSQLECLDISGHNWLDHNTVRTLIHTVNTLPCIKLLSLYFMKLPDDVLLQLHPHVTQVEIRLYDVTMRSQCFHSFIESFVNNKTVVEVVLYECNITSVDGETHRELSVQESLDFMSECLTSIPTVNIMHKGRYKRLDGLMLQFDTQNCQ